MPITPAFIIPPIRCRITGAPATPEMFWSSLFRWLHVLSGVISCDSIRQPCSHTPCQCRFFASFTILKIVQLENLLFLQLSETLFFGTCLPPCLVKHLAFCSFNFLTALSLRNVRNI